MLRMSHFTEEQENTKGGPSQPKASTGPGWPKPSMRQPLRRIVRLFHEAYFYTVTRTIDKLDDTRIVEIAIKPGIKTRVTKL
jgi:hypothetical protein